MREHSHALVVIIMAPKPNPLRDAALAYARKALKILPVHSIEGGICSCGDPECGSPGKHPRIKDWVNDATSDAEQIERWWSKWSNANIGIATGKRSGIIVVDEDPKRGGSVDQLLYDCPTQIVALTGGGGRHLYYAYPEGENKIPNFAGESGVDIRGDGGFVVAPPSLHASGRRYEWDLEDRIGWRGTPGQLPPKVLAALREKGRKQVEGKPVGGARRSTIEAIVAQGVTEGQRNDTMARWVGRLLRKGCRGAELRERCLADNQEHFQPPLSEDEVLKVIASIDNRDAQHTQLKTIHPRQGDAQPPTRTREAQPESNDSKETADSASPQSAMRADPSDQNQAQILLRLADHAELFHTPDQEAYVTLEVDGHRETWSVASTRFRRWLCQGFYNLQLKPPGSEPLRSVIETLAAKAEIEGPEHHVFIRTAEAGGAIYVDLANDAWETVEITKSGWWVVPEPPVRFRRPRGFLPLPRPVAGGSLNELRPFVNIAEDGEDWALLLAWLVTAVRPKGPYPVLVLQGEQGSAKSTLTQLVRALIDPSTASLRAAPRNEHDLVIAAGNSWVLTLDNASRIHGWLSDALCRIATRGGFTTRQLYSDREEVLFDAQRPIIINGIGDLAVRHDLRDRAIILHLPPVPDENRRDEATFSREFETVRPRILGALYEAVSVALRNVTDVQVPVLPRMADAALWATAAEPGLGLRPGAVLAAFLEKRRSAIEESIENDPVALGVLELVATSPWEGTATELLDQLNRRAPQATAGRYWPRNPTQVGQWIARAAAALREVGVEVEHHRDAGRGRSRLISIGPSQDSVRPVRPVRGISGAADTSDTLDTLPQPRHDGVIDRVQPGLLEENPEQTPDEEADRAAGDP